MANPSGKTYHYGEHDPIAEPGGLHVVYKDESEPVGRATTRSVTTRRMTATLANTVARHPILCLGAAAVCGILAASLSRSMGNG